MSPCDCDAIASEISEIRRSLGELRIGLNVHARHNTMTHESALAAIMGNCESIHELRDSIAELSRRIDDANGQERDRINAALGLLRVELANLGARVRALESEQGKHIRLCQVCGQVAHTIGLECSNPKCENYGEISPSPYYLTSTPIYDEQGQQCAIGFDLATGDPRL